MWVWQPQDVREHLEHLVNLDQIMVNINSSCLGLRTKTSWKDFAFKMRSLKTVSISSQGHLTEITAKQCLHSYMCFEIILIQAQNRVSSSEMPEHSAEPFAMTWAGWNGWGNPIVFLWRLVFPFPTSPQKISKFLPPPAEFLEETVYISYKVQTYHVFILKFIYISWLHLFWLISFVSFLSENLARVLVSY